MGKALSLLVVSVALEVYYGCDTPNFLHINMSIASLLSIKTHGDLSPCIDSQLKKLIRIVRRNVRVSLSYRGTSARTRPKTHNRSRLSEFNHGK
jgi:hypothetical protein